MLGFALNLEEEVGSRCRGIEGGRWGIQVPEYLYIPLGGFNFFSFLTMGLLLKV